jgi:hypothetical protein
MDVAGNAAMLQQVSRWCKRVMDTYLNTETPVGLKL